MKEKSIAVRIIQKYCRSDFNHDGGYRRVCVDKKKQNIPERGRRTVHNSDISAGGTKAILTLADGSSIVLDTAQNGYVTNQSNTKIIKLNTGLLSYGIFEKNMLVK